MTDKKLRAEYVQAILKAADAARAIRDPDSDSPELDDALLILGDVTKINFPDADHHWMAAVAGLYAVIGAIGSDQSYLDKFNAVLAPTPYRLVRAS